PASALETLAMVRKLVDEGMSVLLIEHRVEDVLRIHPDRIMFMEDGRIRHLGGLEGLVKVVDYHEVKLPAELIMQRAAADPPPTEIEILPGVSAPSLGEEKASNTKLALKSCTRLTLRSIAAT
ncbi:MAG: hypothetical protein P8X95_19385, partial [Anaerolineales bacterium]